MSIAAATLFSIAALHAPVAAMRPEWQDPLNNCQNLVHVPMDNPTIVRINEGLTALVVPRDVGVNDVLIQRGDKVTMVTDWDSTHPDEATAGTAKLVDFLVASNLRVQSTLEQVTKEYINF